MELARRRFIREETEVLNHFAPRAHAARGAQAASSRGDDSGRGGDSRHGAGRKTEREEDAEMLRAAATDVAGYEENLLDRLHEALPLREQPGILQGGKLRPYQLEGLNWLAGLYRNGVSGILADEMGLGKTVQTVAMIGMLAQHGAPGFHAVLAPKSTLSNWEKEFAKWLPSCRLIVLQGSAEERREIVRTRLATGDFDVLLTSYEVFLREKNAIRKVSWRYFAIDEAHRIKNEASQLALVARELRTAARLLITGTPLQNNLHELWALLNFLLPEEFHSAEDFDTFFRVTDAAAAKDVSVRLQGVLRPFMLRRLKREVEASLLPKQEINVYLPMTSMQKRLYSNILMKDVQAISGKGGDRSQLLNIVMQLRKACNHPYLFEGQEPGPPFVEGEHLVLNAGKTRALDRLLAKMRAAGSRVLIFSQMTRMLDILEDLCNFRGYKFCRIDGQTVGRERQEQIDAFMDDASDHFIFLLSTRAGGLGLNLQKADKVVIYDSDWNPQADIQAMDRAHRIGQTKQVVVYRFIHEQSVEEKVVERAFKKLFLDALFIQQGLSHREHQAMARDELLEMVRFGADSVVRMGEGEGEADLDLDALIEAGRARTDELRTAVGTQAASFSLLPSDASFDRTKDKLYKASEAAPRAAAEAPDFYLELGKRRREPRKEGFYNEDASFRHQLRSYPELKVPDKSEGRDRESKDKEGVVPRFPRHMLMPSLQDYHFVNASRLSALLEKKRHWFRSAHRAKSRLEEELRQEGPSYKGGEKGAAARETERPAGAGLEGLTAEEDAELRAIRAESFEEWTFKDFSHFRRASIKYGRGALPAIAAALPHKPRDEVERYTCAFWDKGPAALRGWDALVRQVERGEAVIAQRKGFMDVVQEALAKVPTPRQLRVEYKKGAERRPWTEASDRFLLQTVAEVGYGRWREVQRRIRGTVEWTADFFFKSRDADDLRARFKSLVRMLQRQEREAKATVDPASVSKRPYIKSKGAHVEAKAGGGTKPENIAKAPNVTRHDGRANHDGGTKAAGDPSQDPPPVRGAAGGKRTAGQGAATLPPGERLRAALGEKRAVDGPHGKRARRAVGDAAPQPME